MRLILYGTEADKDEFMCSVTALPDLRYRKMQVTGYPDYDSFITGLGESPPDCIVIAMDGADGMEGVIAAKSVCKTSRCCGFRMITDSARSPTGSAVRIFIKSLFPRRSSLRRLQDACKGVTR